LTEGQITINKDLTIEGTGLNAITIDGQGASRIFDISANATVRISGMTIAGGYALSGGGILNEAGCTLNLDRVKMSSDVAHGPDDTTGLGGGVENLGSATINNSVFVGNQGNFDGGAVDSSGPTLTINRSTFVNNQSPNGGALNSLRTLVTISDSAFLG